MDNDEEMKNQCFGGEYLGEMYDHMTKRSVQTKWSQPVVLCFVTLQYYMMVSVSAEAT